MQLDDALARYVLQLRGDGRSCLTVRQSERHLRAYARWTARVGLDADLAAHGAEDLARFLTAPEALLRPDGEPKRANSVNALRSSLRAFFAFLHAADLLPRNPAHLVRRARAGVAPPRGISERDQALLLATIAAADGPAARRDEALIRLLLGTGLRIGSALALRVEDVDLEGAELELRCMKNDRPDRLAISAEVAEVLRAFLGDRTSGWVFQGQAGGSLTARQAQRRLAEWQHKAGIRRPVTPHGFRHAFAQGLYGATRDPFRLKEALRHRSLASTLIYAS